MQKKVIDLTSDKFCQIVCCDSDEPRPHRFKEIKISYASEPSIELSSCCRSHRDNIIHCYMLATSSNRTILSYIPLLQLTLSEIIECTKDKTFLSVEVIVIFSKISPERLDNFDNVRAECL